MHFCHWNNIFPLHLVYNAFALTAATATTPLLSFLTSVCPCVDQHERAGASDDLIQIAVGMSSDIILGAAQRQRWNRDGTGTG